MAKGAFNDYAVRKNVIQTDDEVNNDVKYSRPLGRVILPLQPSYFAVLTIAVLWDLFILATASFLRKFLRKDVFVEWYETIVVLKAITVNRCG